MLVHRFSQEHDRAHPHLMGLASVLKLGSLYDLWKISTFHLETGSKLYSLATEGSG
jgi:hypothetical protein